MKILIADDDSKIRDNLTIIFQMEEGFEVVGTAVNGREAYEMCTVTHPDVVLMDLRMPVMDGVLGTKLIKENLDKIKVIILTTIKEDNYIKEALDSGAEGYILKKECNKNIIDIIKKFN